MKKIYLTLLAVLCIAAVGMAQSTISINPSSVQTPAPAAETDIEAHIDISNLTNEEISVKWNRLTIEIGQGCNTQVCDFNACYAHWIDSKAFNMPADTTGEIILHLVKNAGVECCAIIHLQLWDEGNTADTLTAMFLYNQCASSAGYELPAADVRAFPNPATDFVQLQNAEDVGQIRIYNMEGKLVSYQHATPDHQYPVHTFPTGTYIFALEDEKGNVFQAMEIVKQ